MRRLLLLLLLVVLLLLGVGAGLVHSVAAARAAVGPGLNNGSEYEELVAQPTGYGDQGTITITNVQCDSAGASSFDLAASGVAYGPYPGTFEETATVTIGPSGELQIFDASFTIHSGDTAVTGTKHLYADDPERYSSGACSGTYSAEAGSCDSSQQLFASTNYAATLADASGSFTDSGIATVQFDASQPGCGSASVGNFIETFVASSITNPLPGSLELRQSESVDVVGTSHIVTAYVTTEGQTETVGGATVYFAVSGADTASGVCTTDTEGLCDFTYQGPTFPGSDTISSYVDVDVNGNGIQDAGEPAASVTKQWVLPLSTPGQASGAGQSGSLAFAVNFKSDKGVLKGTCSIALAALAKTMIKCVDVTAYVQAANTVTIYGNALINGSPVQYRITIADNGKPGADVFRVETSTGFSAGGVLTAGNIVVG